MPLPLYIMNVDAFGLAIHVSFNGVPLLEMAASESLASAERVTAWAISGPNRITVGLSPLPGGATPGGGLALPRFGLRLRRSARGADPAAAQEICAFQWAGPAIQPLPHREQMTVDLDGVPDWSWIHAPAGSIGADDRTEIVAQVSQLADQLAKRDIDGAVASQAVLLDEQGVAADMAPMAMRQQYAEFLRERMAHPDWFVRPFEAKDVELRALAGGRLQMAQRAGGRPLIETRSAVGLYTAEPILTKFNGRWIIVR